MQTIKPNSFLGKGSNVDRLAALEFMKRGYSVETPPQKFKNNQTEAIVSAMQVTTNKPTLKKYGLNLVNTDWIVETSEGKEPRVRYSDFQFRKFFTVEKEQEDVV